MKMSDLLEKLNEGEALPLEMRELSEKEVFIVSGGSCNSGGGGSRML